MKYRVYLLVLVFIIFATDACSEVSSAANILSSLSSSNEVEIDKTIKSLGIERGISGGFEKFRVLRPSHNHNLYILTLSWNPPDGYLILLNSDGQVLSRMKTGYIKSICLHELGRVENGDLIILDSIAEQGSGYNKDTYKIILVNNDGLRIIWEDISLLSDIYMQNKEVNGFIKFDSSGDGPKLYYESTIKSYSYDKQSETWSVERTETHSKTYIFTKGQFHLYRQGSGK